MKSIFKYYIIIFVSFIILTKAQASEHCHIISSPAPTISAAKPKKLTGQSRPHALAGARFLSMRARTTALPAEEGTRLTVPIIDEVSEDHSDHENSSEQNSNSSHSTQEKLALIRRLSQHAMPKQQQNHMEPRSKKTISVSRNYFNTIEKSVGVLIIAAGAYKLFRFCVPSESQSTRGGIPTDMVGAAFWGANALSRFASSGLTFVVVAYAGHKVKSFVDGIYEDRFDKKLKPIRANIETLSRYVDDRTNPLAQGQQFLCDVSEDQAKLLEALALQFHEQVPIIRLLTNRHAKKHPTSPESADVQRRVEEIARETDEIVHNAHAITEEIEERKKHEPRPAINPITSKTNSGKCCGIKCSMM